MKICVPTTRILTPFFLALFVLISGRVSGTNIIDPAGAGGFELGATFADNGWTVTNGVGITNTWQLGTVPPGFTNRAAFVSSDNGTTWNYNNGTTSIVHLWRDVTFPAGESNVQLTFNWQALGEVSSFDALMVSIAPTSYVPTASNTSLGTGVLAAPANTLVQLWNVGGVQSANISLPSNLIGNCSAATTLRLIFTWKNDGSLGTSPPAAIDNISLVSLAPPAPLSGTYTVGPTGTYATLTAATADLNTRGVSAPVIFELQAAYTSATETFPIVLSGQTNCNVPNAASTVTIRPAAGAPLLSILGGNAGPTIDINSGGFWIIDGRPGGVGTTQGLVISNNQTTGQAIRYINESSNNIVRYCDIQGVNTSTTSGVVLFSTTTGLNGNDNNLIDNCNIHEGATTPTNCVFSSGTTTTISQNNSFNTISNCNIYNWFNSASVSVGVNIAAGNTVWTISGNSFYQTAARVLAAQFSAVVMSSTVSNSMVLSNNFMGGSAPLCGGGQMVLTGTGNLRMVNATTGPGVSLIQGNTIQNINYTTTNATNFNGGLVLGQGAFNVNNNTIGSLTANDNIVVSASGSTFAFCGIIVGGVAPTNTITITNNSIGGIGLSVTGAPATPGLVRGISIQGTAINHNYVVTGNTVGSTTLANNITSNSNVAGSILGIASFSNALGQVVSNNTVSNLTSTNTGTANVLWGILLQGNASIGTYTATSNTVQNLTLTTGNVANFSLVGIQLSTNLTTLGTNIIRSNTVRNLVQANTAAGGSAAGIVATVPTVNTNFVDQNLIHSLNSATTTNSGTLTGILMTAGAATVSNNMIRLGVDANGADVNNGVSFVGIQEGTAVANNVLFNSVYIGGAAVSAGTANTFGLLSTATTGTRNYLNNILYNARSNAGGTGKHYAIALGGAAPNVVGASSNYNDLFATGTGGFTGIYNAIDQATIANWRTASGLDFQSISADPKYLTPNGTSATVNLRINPAVPTSVEAAGQPVSAITVDYDNQTRSTLTPTDIGADAGNFQLLDVSAPGIGFTPLNNACGTGDFTLSNVNITDGTGIPLAGALIPRMYYRKNSGAWFSRPGVLQSGAAVNSVWAFTSSVAADLGGIVAGDIIDYYIIAQDNLGNVGSNGGGVVAIDVNTVTIHPVTPNKITVLNALNGTYTVGVGGNYTTLTLAVADYNTRCISGPVVFSLTDAIYPSETYPITINTNADASATNTLTIKPATGVTASITGSSATGLIVLNGADWVRINGSNGSVANTICPPSAATRDLTLTNTSTSTTSAVIWLQNVASTANGASNNQILNCVISGNGPLQTLCGIGAGNPTLGTASLGVNNSFNSFINNSIRNAQYGIISQGNSFGNKNTGNIINQNLLNTAAPLNLATGGVFVTYEDNITISGNNIAGMSQISSPDVFGINVGFLHSGLSATTFVGNECTNVTITQNIISSVVNSGTFSAAGIALAASASGTTLIANNMISGVSSNGTAGDMSAGILLGGGAGVNINVLNNTVSMQGTMAGTNAGTSVTSALMVTTSNPPSNLVVKNNIFSTTQVGNAGATVRFASIALGYSSLPGNYTGLTSENNDLFCQGAGPGTYQVGITGGVAAGTSRTTIANWRTETGRDLLSQNVAPVFTALSDLHLVAADPANAVLICGGSPVAQVTNDIDCAARNSISPSIGADEIPLSFTATIDVAETSGTLNDGTICEGSNVTLTASGATSYLWSTGQTTPSILVNPATTTTYSVTASNGACSTTTSTVITVNPVPVVTIIITETSGTPNDGTVSCGDPTTLTATGGGTYAWSSGPNSAAILVSPLASTTYTVTVTSASGCTSTKSVSITVNPSPVLTETHIDPVDCFTTSGSIDLSVNPAGTYTYNWVSNNGTGLVNGQQDQPNLGVGIYNVTVTNGNTGCSNSLSVTLSVPGGCSGCAPVGSVTVNPTAICPGGTATFTANGSLPNATFAWYDMLTGGNLVGTGNPLVSAPLVANTTYCVEQTVGLPAQSQTFNFTGGVQTFTVPAGVTSITVEAFGAEGAAGEGPDGGGTGAKGGKATGVLSVTPGQVLNIYVGGAASGQTGGFNGGGTGGSLTGPNQSGGTGLGGGGGGASDIRVGGTNLTDRVIVAGGGGGGGVAGCIGAFSGGNGGAGGGGNGTKGTDSSSGGGGFGGSVGAGGAKGIGCPNFSGTDGIVADGGHGQACCCFSHPTIPAGGGGGGGYVQGGGGGGGSAGTVGCQFNDKGGGGGGAGGSSYIGGVSGGTTTNGLQVGNGQITLTYSTLCTSDRVCGTVTVNPTPNAVATPAAQTICSGNAITTIVLSGNVPNTTFNWTRNNIATVTGIAANGTGNIAGALTNTTNAPITVTFTITPTANNCPGAPITATVLVNPTPNAVATPAAQTICSGAAITTIVLSGNVANTTFNWTRDNVATVTGIAANGAGNIAGALTNTTNAPITVTFTITSTANGCAGAPINATVLVNPVPSTFALTGGGTVCNTDITGVPVGLSGSQLNVNYQLRLNGNPVGAPVAGTGGPISFGAQLAGAYTVLATHTQGGCTSVMTGTINIGSINCGVSISDPCVCKNNATTLTNGQFGEVIKVTAPDGQVWTVSAINGLFSQFSPSPPANPFPIAVGTNLIVLGGNMYTLTGVHVDAIGYTVSVTNGRGTTLSIGNSCAYPNPSITTAFPAEICLFSDPIALTGNPGDGNIVSQTFRVNGVVTNTLDPSLGTGAYTIVYTVDGGTPKAAGPNDPGCVQSVSTIVNVVVTPTNVVCNDLVYVSLDADCTESLNPDDVLEGTYLCFDDYVLDVDKNAPFGNGPWLPGDFNASDIGKTYQVRVTHLVSGNKCWGTLKIEDKLAPALTCVDFNIPCNTPNVTPGYLVNTLGIPQANPQATDCQAVTLTYIDSEVPQNCASGLTKIINRKWTATDASGNTSTCIQNIGFIRPTLNDVVPPPDYDDIDADAFSCESNVPLVNGRPNPTPDWIESRGLQGYPYVFGEPSGCNINWEYHDFPIEVCDGTIKYRREWTLIDWCIGDGFIYNQIIKVVDEAGPAFTCPANITVSTDPFTCCATINLPDVTVEDNCSRVNNLSGMITLRDAFTGDVINMVSIGGTLEDFPGNNWWDRDTLANFGWTPCMPAGNHTVTYVAEDDCGNTTSCVFNLVVRDLVPPVAACDQTTTVAIGLDDPFDCYGPAGPNGVPGAQDACEFAGVTWVKATTFNDGSYDNCNAVKFSIRRMAPYSDCILGLNSVRGEAPCDAPFPSFPPIPSEFQRATDDQDSIKFYCCEVGTTQTVVLTVTQLNVDGSTAVYPDGSPIISECMIQVEVQDKIKPSCLPPAQVSVNCENFDPSLWSYGKATVADNCCLDTSKVYQGQCGLSHSVNYALFDTVCNKGTITRTFRAFDCHGFSSSCTQRVIVTYDQDYFIKFPNDVIVTVCDGSGNYGEPIFFGEDCELLGVSFTDEVFTVVPDACFKIERNWQIINWCTYDPNAPCIYVDNPTPNPIANAPQNLPGPTVSAPGTLAPWKSTIVKINPTDPLPGTDFSIYWQKNANCYQYKQIIKVVDGQAPTGTYTVPDCSNQNWFTPNRGDLWNEMYWWDNGLQIHDLCEEPTDLCITATDACSGANVNIEYLLFLDLDGNGSMETVINSVNTGIAGLGWNNVLYNNLNTPNFAGGTPSAFDERAVLSNQKYGFAIQETINGTNKTACVRWNTQQQQNTYVVPELPHGTHKIKWFITDGCGNNKEYEYTFTVKDCKAPTVVCLNGLSVNIMPTGMITLWASDFLQYTEDNCTPNPLKIGIRKCGTGTGFPVDAFGNPITNVNFTCAELGTQCVELWAIDAAGNADYCETYVIVQDNNGNCGAGNTVNVAGALKTETGDGVEEATINIDGSVNFAPPFSYFDLTDENGLYQVLSNVPMSADFVIAPEKDDNPLNGVTTYDLVLISKHILGLEPLNTPYKMIAADANKSGSITTFDIVEIRKLILGIYTELPNNTSWRFVDEAFVFPSPNNPFQTVFPEVISIADAVINQMDNDFVGVKIGDVNNTTVPNATAQSEERTHGTAIFDLEDRTVKAGEEFEVTFKSAQALKGFQFTLTLNGLKAISTVNADQVNEGNFNLAPANAMTVSIDGAQGFTVRFRAEKAGKLSEMLGVSGAITRAEAYGDAGRLNVAFRFDGKTIAGVGFELYQNQPNPFVNKTNIGFYLPEAAEATLSVFDETGRVVYQQKGQFAKGENSIQLDRALINTTGMLYYKLETATDSDTKKMIQAK